jgi:hypothetical protein
MAFGIGDLLQTLQQGVQAINNLTTQIATTFPQATTASTTAPSSVGAITFTSSQAAGFLLVALSSGVTVKFPFYPE